MGRENTPFPKILSNKKGTTLGSLLPLSDVKYMRLLYIKTKESDERTTVMILQDTMLNLLKRLLISYIRDIVCWHKKCDQNIDAMPVRFVLLLKMVRVIVVLCVSVWVNTDIMMWMFALLDIHQCGTQNKTYYAVKVPLWCICFDTIIRYHAFCFQFISFQLITLHTLLGERIQSINHNNGSM